MLVFYVYGALGRIISFYSTVLYVAYIAVAFPLLGLTYGIDRVLDSAILYNDVQVYWNDSRKRSDVLLGEIVGGLLRGLFDFFLFYSFF